MLSSTLFFLLSIFATLGFAATAEEWKSRSIYQLLTDRFALPDGVEATECDPTAQTWCGGTWNGIRQKLDYIQDAGFTAIWISPVHKNIEEHTEYGDPYHGYWVTDLTQLNSNFGTEADLRALIKDLHDRGMYLMVDIVVNNVVATTTEPDYANSDYFFKDAAYYRPYCPIEYPAEEITEQECWMGDDKVTHPDVDTTMPEVRAQYGDWIEAFVKDYEIDGLRIDAAKHVEPEFWPDFCGRAGVFCMGEVFGGSEVGPIAKWQGPLDSVLNFPLYSALRDAFAIPGLQDIDGLVQVFEAARAEFSDMSVLGNFLENHDLPRWHNLSVDPQSLFNAMAWNFMTEGIPVVYAGQEQGFSGLSDPHNREALWPSQYENTTAYQTITTYNKLRNFLIAETDWMTHETQILSSGEHGIGFSRGMVVTVLTNIGSPPAKGVHIAVQTPYPSSTAMTNIMTCKQWVVGAGGSIDVEYSQGGVPVILVPSSQLGKSGLCGADLARIAKAGGKQTGAAAATRPPRWLGALLVAASFWLALGP